MEGLFYDEMIPIQVLFSTTLAQHEVKLLLSTRHERALVSKVVVNSLNLGYLGLKEPVSMKNDVAILCLLFPSTLWRSIYRKKVHEHPVNKGIFSAITALLVIHRDGLRNKIATVQYILYFATGILVRLCGVDLNTKLVLCYCSGASRTGYSEHPQIQVAIAIFHFSSHLQHRVTEQYTSGPSFFTIEESIFAVKSTAGVLSANQSVMSILGGTQPNAYGTKCIDVSLLLENGKHTSTTEIGLYILLLALFCGIRVSRLGGYTGVTKLLLLLVLVEFIGQGYTPWFSAGSRCYTIGGSIQVQIRRGVAQSSHYIAALAAFLFSQSVENTLNCPG